MLPWDMLVTVTGYWHYKLRDTEEGECNEEEDECSDEDELNEYKIISQKFFLNVILAFLS